ncbi:hypothetical protein HX792_19030 [Pseudomonas sp. B6002]|nr:hypothetical protein [Pseudomonas sp. B6002]
MELKPPRWPRTLTLIYLACLVIAQGLAFAIEISALAESLWLTPLLMVQLALLFGCLWLGLRPSPPDNAPADAPGNGLQERLQLLAAISHDLQTPITRMKLRAEFMEESVERDKLCNDLCEMQHLVQEGVAYARSLDGTVEASCRVDLHSFLDSLVFDYQDVGQSVVLRAQLGTIIDTRPHALRRVLVNLVDNALKFGSEVTVNVEPLVDERLVIQVLDRGPGIPEAQLPEVIKPFYRLDNARSRSTKGTGLGLAISQQLAQSLQGALTLSNRAGGGLCAQLALPQSVAPHKLPR